MGGEPVTPIPRDLIDRFIILARLHGAGDDPAPASGVAAQIVQATVPLMAHAWAEMYSVQPWAMNAPADVWETVMLLRLRFNDLDEVPDELSGLWNQMMDQTGIPLIDKD